MSPETCGHAGAQLVLSETKTVVQCDRMGEPGNHAWTNCPGAGCMFGQGALVLDDDKKENTDGTYKEEAE